MGISLSEFSAQEIKQTFSIESFNIHFVPLWLSQLFTSSGTGGVHITQRVCDSVTVSSVKQNGGTGKFLRNTSRQFHTLHLLSHKVKRFCDNWVLRFVLSGPKRNCW